MSADIRQRAIEPFFTTKGRERGTGLGLAMVHGFVQQSLGRLEIESEPGQGTTMRMLFPVAPAREAGTPPPPQAAPSRPLAHREGQTILLVEDCDDVRALASEQLSGLGYRVIVAASGEEALAKLPGLKIDLLFTDIVMPGGMSGLELVEKFSELNPTTPVLMTTGYNEDLVADIPRGTRLDVIGKPYRREELADRVYVALNRQTSTRRDESEFGAKEG